MKCRHVRRGQLQRAGAYLRAPTANSSININTSWAQGDLKNDLGLEKHNSNLPMQLQTDESKLCFFT